MTQKSHRLMFRFWLDMVKPEEEELADTIELLKNERSFSKTIRDGIQLITNLREGKLDVLFELFPWVKAEFIEYMRDIQPTMAPEAEQTRSPQQVAQPDTANQAWLEAEQERLEAERLWQEKRLAEAEKALEVEREKIEVERTQGQKAIQEQLDRLEQLLLQQGNQPIPMDRASAERDSGGGRGQAVKLKPVQSSGAAGPKPLNVPQFELFPDEDDDSLWDMKKDETTRQRVGQNFIGSLRKLNSNI